MSNGFFPAINPELGGSLNRRRALADAGRGPMPVDPLSLLGGLPSFSSSASSALRSQTRVGLKTGDFTVGGGGAPAERIIKSAAPAVIAVFSIGAIIWALTR